jgi:hypothetical protein
MRKPTSVLLGLCAFSLTGVLPVLLFVGLAAACGGIESAGSSAVPAWTSASTCSGLLNQ